MAHTTVNEAAEVEELDAQLNAEGASVEATEPEKKPEQLKQAVRSMQKFLRKNVLDRFIPRSAVWFFEKGVEAYREDDLEEAIECYQAAIEKNPNIAEVYFNLGICYEALNMSDEAREAYRNCLDLNPDDPECLYNMARLLYEGKEIREALKLLEHAVELDGSEEDVDILTLLGFNYEEDKQIDKAIGSYTKVIELDETSMICRVYAVKLLIQKRDVETAKQYIPDASFLEEIEIDSPELQYELALCYAKLGNWEGSIKCCHKILEMDPTHTKAFNQLGLAYYCSDDYPSAIEYYEKALEVDPTYATALNNLAYTYEKAENYDKAIEKFENYIRLLSDESAEKQEVLNHIEILRQKAVV